MRLPEKRSSIVIKPLVHALERHKLEEATPCVVGAVADRHLPEREALAPWLSENLGVRRMRELWISRCATYARRADRHLRQSLHDLAKVGGGHSADAAFYEEISKRPEMISQLEHPFLRRRMAATRRSAGPAKGTGRVSKGAAAATKSKRRRWLKRPVA